MAAIIGIIQVKGGVGRSTIATNLAGILSLSQPTLLIDCDMPQGTSSSWYALRQEELPVSMLDLNQVHDYRQLVSRCRQLAPSYDYIIIDGPPRIAEMTRAILLLSTLCLIPLGASAAEIWSTGDLVKTLEEARRLRPDIDARLVWNRIRGRTREAQEVRAAAESTLALKELAAALSYRVAYSEALARGLCADEWLDRVAHGEIRQLVDELQTILRG